MLTTGLVALTVAVQNLRTLMKYFIKHRKRLLDIIEGVADPNIPMNRPHIRFDGRSLEEVKEKWAHAQNDALGYFSLDVLQPRK
jgi:hypothetical protein